MYGDRHPNTTTEIANGPYSIVRWDAVCHTQCQSAGLCCGFSASALGSCCCVWEGGRRWPVLGFLLGFSSSPRCCGHSGSEPVDGISLPPSLPLSSRYNWKLSCRNELGSKYQWCSSQIMKQPLARILCNHESCMVWCTGIVGERSVFLDGGYRCTMMLT